MIAIRQISLMLAAASLALILTAGPSLAGSYIAVSYAPSTQTAANPAIQYVYFDPTTPASPTASGWVGDGRYSLPPALGAATVDTAAFGSLMTDPSGQPAQAFVVRLGIINSGTQLMAIDPSAVRLVDRDGRVLVGARAFSGDTRVTMETIGPGGKDTLQLEFPLPPGVDLRTLTLEDVDLPYSYGATAYVAHLDFLSSEGKGIYNAPANPYTTMTAPAGNGYGSYADTAPQYFYADTGYMAYPDDWSWGSSWWWPWWGSGFVSFGDDFFHHHGRDGDFDRDDGFFGHADAKAQALHHATTTMNNTLRSDRKAPLTGGTVNTKGLQNTARLTGPGTVTNNVIRSNIVTGGNHTSTTVLMAPRSGSTTFSAPRSGTTTFSAPHLSGGGSFSASHFSGGGSFSASHFSGGGGGGGGSHGGGGGHR